MNCARWFVYLFNYLIKLSSRIIKDQKNNDTGDRRG